MNEFEATMAKARKSLEISQKNRKDRHDDRSAWTRSQRDYEQDEQDRAALARAVLKRKRRREKLQRDHG